MPRVLALLFVLSLSGCVAHVPLTKQVPPVEYTSATGIALSVIDDRQRVKQGKPRNFIGVAHGVFGIPTDWRIKPVLAVEEGDEDRDLAEFLRHRLSSGFTDRGWNAVEVPLDHIPEATAARTLIEQHHVGKLLILQLTEWFFSINLSWVTAFNFDTDTTVLVYSGTGEKAFEKRFAERDVVDAEADQSYQNHILLAYRDQLAQILNDPEVKQALTAP